MAVVTLTPGTAIPDSTAVEFDFPTITAADPDAVVGAITLKLYLYFGYPPDMEVTLIHPDGTEALVFSYAGTFTGDIGSSSTDPMVFVDGGQWIQFGTPPWTDQEYEPRELFDVKFGGKDPDGVWKLRVEDLFDGAEMIFDFAELTVEEALPTFPDDLPLTIPDDDDAGLVVTIPVATTGAIGDMALELYATHPYVSDLTITLRHPDGTEVVVFQALGDDGDDIGVSAGSPTIFTDDATADIETSSPPFAGEQKPMFPFSAFVGKPREGNWRLTVVDGAAADVGTLHHVALTFGGEIIVDLEVTPALIEWAYELRSGDAPDPVELAITNADGSVPYTATVENMDGPYGQTALIHSVGLSDSTDATDPVSTTVDDDMAPGVYTGSITYTSGASVVVVPVTLTVTETGEGTGPMTGDGVEGVGGSAVAGSVSRHSRVEGSPT